MPAKYLRPYSQDQQKEFRDAKATPRVCSLRGRVGELGPFDLLDLRV